MKHFDRDNQYKILRLIINNTFIISLILFRFSVVGFYFYTWWIVLLVLFAFHTFITNRALNRISRFSVLNKIIVFISSLCLFIFTMIQFDGDQKGYGAVVELFSKLYLNINFVLPIGTSNLLFLSIGSFFVLIYLDYYLFKQVKKLS
jgi:hypothetical protein